MKKVDKMIDDVKNFIDEVFDKAQKPVKKVLRFVREHKRLILVIVLAYLAFTYLFGEESDEYLED